MGYEIHINCQIIYEYMLGCCQSSKEKLEKDPQKYLKSHIMVCMLEGNTIVCSIAEKKNNSGIMYNDRLLLLYGHKYLGYFNKIEPTVTLPYKSLLDIPVMKHQVPLKNFIEWSIKDKVFTLKYFVEAKGKKENKEWVFKFDSLDLSKDWKFHLRRAEQERKDYERREFELKNNPPSIIRIEESFKDNRGVIGVYDEEKDPKIGKIEQHPYSHATYEPVRIVEPESNIKHQKVNKPTSLLYTQNSPPQSERIIDKTGQPQSQYSKIKTPSPKSAKSAQSAKSRSSLKQSKFSPIDNIHARSPSLHSSIHESPSPPRSNSHSPSHVLSRDKTSQVNEQEKPKYMSLYSSKPQQHSSVISNPREIKQVNQQLSPRWKQPVLSKQKWNHRLQKQNLPYTLYEFSKFSKATSKQIVDNLSIGNPQLKLKRKSEYQLMVEYEGLTAYLCFTGEKTETNREQSQPHIDTFLEVTKQFNNMQYIFTCLQNKLEPFIALTSITFYKGILIYLVCPISSNSSPATFPSSLYQKVIEKTRISTALKPQNLAVDKQLNKTYLSKLSQYLPSLKGIQLQRNFLQLSNFQSQKFQSVDLSTTHSKNDRKSEYFNKTLSEHLKYSVQCLDNFNEYVVNSHQFQQFLINYGINELSLGELHQLSTTPYTKQIIAYECIFRIAKQIYFKQLQVTLTSTTDMSSNLIIDKNILLLNSNKTLIDITVDFLNSMVGKYKNAEVVWEIINNELGEKFGLYGVEVVFNDGYYLQGLVHHFNIGINWSGIKTKKGFNPEFSHSTITQFKTSNKVYNCDFHLEFKGIAKLLRTKTQESYKVLLQSLDLYKSPIPEYYKLTGLYDQIKVFLSLFLSPAQERERFSHLNLYESIGMEPPTSSSIQLHIDYLKWTLKENNKEEAIKVFDDISNIINRWLGPHHPYLLQIYNLLSSYYESIEQYDDAIALAKSSIVNCLKAFGNNSLRLADSYSFLADIYSSMQKHDQSLIYEKKARNIFDSNNQTNNIDYILMLTRISRLELHFGKVNAAKENIQQCLRYFENNQSKEEYIVSAYQIAARCYEVTKDIKEYKNLVVRIALKLVTILDPLHLEKCIKIVVIYPLKELKKESKFIIKQIIEKLPKGITEQAYIEGYQYIRGCFKQDRFDLYLEETFKNVKPVQSLENTIAVRGNYSDNKKAERLVEALRNFLGAPFVMKFIN